MVQHRQGRRGGSGLRHVLGITLLFSTASLCLGAPSSSPDAPQLMVVVMAATIGPDQVAVVYPGKQSHQQVRQHLDRLRQLSRWDMGPSRIADSRGPSLGGRATLMTGADFAAVGAAPKDSGVFDLDPILQAFRGYRRLEIQYLTPRAFRYTGAQAFDDPNLHVSVVTQPGSYRFDVLIRNPKFGHFRMPLQPVAASQPLPAKRSRPALWQIAAWLVLALGVGLLAYAASDWLRNSPRAAQGSADNADQ